MANNSKVQSAEFLLSEQWEWVGRFDQKIAVALSLELAMLGVLITMSPHFELWNTITLIFGIFCFILLSTGIFYIVRASIPNIKLPVDEDKKPIPSLVFFGSIAAKHHHDYVEAFVEIDDTTYLKDLLIQIHRNSEIITAKAKYLKLSYFWLFSSLLPFIITLTLYKGIGV